MDEETLKELLQDYFVDSFQITSYIENCKDCVANVKCNIQHQSDVNDLIKFDSKETNKTLK